MGKLSKDKRDIYYRLAKQNNYRSRAAYKLIQVDYHFNLLENSSLIVDLCAAPGGFSQVCSQRLKSKKSKKIISVDLQEIAPIEDVDILIGDITNQETLQKILELSENNQFFILYELQVSDQINLCLTEIATLNAIKYIFLAFPSVHLIIMFSDEEYYNKNSMKYLYMQLFSQGN